MLAKIAWEQINFIFLGSSLKFEDIEKHMKTRKNILIFTVIWVKIRSEDSYTLAHFMIYLLLKVKSCSRL